ncbi:MAG TPA: DUF3095 domain-containing protein [Burkholderiaceae bacterium]|jgi:hypothetical protein|nr:DUF3095 domain-containing protein [Burkholderiaceae bacterium]
MSAPAVPGAQASDAAFQASVPVFDAFDQVADPARYLPLPDGWVIGNADIVKSTQAKAAGRAKAVNLAGAAVIAGVTNALAGEQVAYVFGGDGASFAVPARLAEPAGAALAAVAAWATHELELPMRCGMVPIAAIRAAGLDVLLARYAASPDVRYALFAGGGLRWADGQIKAGRFGLAPAGADAQPDLTGLSCNWEQVPSSLGTILTVILVPRGRFDAPAFTDLAKRLNALLADASQARCPLPEGGPPLRWPPTGLGLLARVRRRPGEWAVWLRARLAAETLFNALLLWSGWKAGNFDPARYRRELVANADFRGYDDGLRMTLDCTLAQADRIEALLAQARAQGVARYGTHREDAALMTCIAPLPSRSDHVHFIDGAAGGYTLAALRMKSDA